MTAAGGIASGYSDGPPPGHTGGFDEPTCRSCHSDNPINDPSAWLRVDGVPATYEAGREYEIELTLSRAGLGSGGFQLAARFITGDGAGAQAGDFQVPDNRVQIVNHGRPEVQYVQHSDRGTRMAGPDTVSWHLQWTAPLEPGQVVFHLAANAANNDASEFGDFVVLRRLFTTASWPEQN